MDTKNTLPLSPRQALSLWLKQYVTNEEGRYSEKDFEGTGSKVHGGPAKAYRKEGDDQRELHWC